MSEPRKGITVAGNILTDIVKSIDCYPAVGMLANVFDVRRSVGGCAPNTAIDLAKIDCNIPISVLGKIGNDEYGQYLLHEMERHKIDCSGVVVTGDKPTGFSDVMSLPSGERTFFYARGANAAFCPDDIDLSAVNSRILHIGYILLLDEFDKPDEEYGTVMARFLHDAQQHGLKTSVDVVSDSAADYKSKVIPALKYCDYVVVNEYESGMISGLPPYNADGTLNTENIHSTMAYMAQCGVRSKVIVHCKQAGFCLDVPTGQFTAVPSLNIPEQEIKGSVGAGDAFCAGSLYGIYNGFDDKTILEFAAAAAACSLFSENSVDGMLPKCEIEKLAERYGWKAL